MIKIFNTLLKEYRIHFLAWAMFITWEVVFIGIFFGDFGHPLTYTIHYSLIIGFFYLHSLYLLSWALKIKSQIIWRVPIIISIEIGGLILLSFFVDNVLIQQGFLKSTYPLTFNLQYCLKSLYRGLYFLGFATGYYYLSTYLKEKKKTEDLEIRHLSDIIERKIADEQISKAQNAFLMAQINPHFFFNTLDYLYHNVLLVSPESAEAISVLATVMRFAIDADKVGDFIKLGDEIEQVENLIYLNQLRQPLFINFVVDEEARELWFIPLVLLTLTENIFKHGNTKEAARGANIIISLKENFLQIDANNLANKSCSTRKSNTGLINIEKRLKSAYGQDVTFTHGGEERFEVSILVPLVYLNTFGSSSNPLVSTGKE